MHVYVLALCSTCLICMSGVLSVSIFHMKRKKKKKSELLTCLMILEIFNGPCHWSEFPYFHKIVFMFSFVYGFARITTFVFLKAAIS